MSAQFRSRRAFIVVLLSVLAFLVLPRTARTEPLGLSPTAAAECPDCETATGGAQAINYFEQLAPQEDVTLTPPDGAARRPTDGTPPPSRWSSTRARTPPRRTPPAKPLTSSPPRASSSRRRRGRSRSCAAPDPMPGGPRDRHLHRLHIGAGPRRCTCGSSAATTRTPTPTSSATSPGCPGPAPTTTGLPATPDRCPSRRVVPGLGRAEPVRLQLLQLRVARRDHRQPVQVRPAAAALRDRALGDDALPLQQRPATADRGLRPHARDVRQPPLSATARRLSGSVGDDIGSCARRRLRARTSPTLPGTSSTTRASRSLRLWLEHELSPRCHADPTKSTVNVPEPLDGESETSFEDCLTTLGLVPTAVELPDADLDAGYGEPVWSDPGWEASADPGRASTSMSTRRNPVQGPRTTSTASPPTRRRTTRATSRPATWVAIPNCSHAPNQRSRAIPATTC